MQGSCTKCGTFRRTLHRDHIIPKWAGGLDDPSNIQLLCANCHEDKTVDEKRTPEYAAVVGPASSLARRREWASRTTEERRAHGRRMRAGRTTSPAAPWTSEEQTRRWADPRYRQKMLDAMAAGRARRGAL